MRCDYSENNDVELAKLRLTDCYKKLPIRSRSPLTVADRGCTLHIQELGAYIKAHNMQKHTAYKKKMERENAANTERRAYMKTSAKKKTLQIQSNNRNAPGL